LTFLNVILDSYEGTELYEELNDCKMSVEREIGINDQIEIPFIIAAMNDVEVSEIMSGETFDNDPDAKERFQKFLAELRKHGIDLEKRYGQRRNDWIPAFDSDKTIESIIKSVCELIRDKIPLIIPEFMSDGIFDDKERQSDTRARLKESGGVLIVDAVSFFHPALRSNLVDSGIIYKESIAVLVVYPLHLKLININNIIEEEIEKARFGEVHKRYCDDIDRLCEISVGDLNALTRRLMSILPEEIITVTKKKPNPSRQKVFRKGLGYPNGRTPKGELGKIVTGQRPIK